MQVSVEAAEGLQRLMTVSVPKEQVDQEYNTRLKAAARQVKINGFRPGKVPAHVIKQRYGEHIRKEALDEVMKKTMQEAVEQSGLRFASMPELDAFDDKGEGHEFSYTVRFEVYPDVTNLVLDGISVDKPVVDINDADIDEMIEVLRRQRQTWQRVERAAQEGDRVTTNYTGTIDGKAFTGSTSTGEQVIIGEGHYLKDFEDALISAEPNAQIEIDTQFPDNYPHQDVAGKAVHFSITVTAIEEPILPEVNDQFIANYSIKEGDMAAFRDEVRDNLSRTRDNEINNQVKQAVFDALMEKNPIDAPTQLIKDEAKHMAEIFENDLRAKGLQLNQPIEVERFESEAERRVKMGLLLNEIVRNNELTPDPDKVYSRIESLAASYEDPQAYIAWHYESKDRLANIETSVLEDQVMELLLAQVNVNEVTESFKDLMAKKR
jgi:trigger factor